MMIVNALAGTGKTTTLLYGLGKRVPDGVQLSDEQIKIITEMRSYNWGNCAAQAFNTTIADKLKKDIVDCPPGIDAATCNSFGARAWNAFMGKRVALNNDKAFEDAKSVTGHLKWQDRFSMSAKISQVVGHCKGFLIDPVQEPERVAWLCDRFDIDCTEELIEYVQQVFTIGVKNADRVIDYNDQTFMPLYRGAVKPIYDLVIVDELQDLNVAKQMFAILSAKEWIVGVGDVNQAIYGFAGADSEAVSNFSGLVRNMAKDRMKDFFEMPLTTTWRNSKAVVRRAQRWVPELKAAPHAIEGQVLEESGYKYSDRLVEDSQGRMVLCRINAPLASLAFQLLARKRRCYIQGRDLGTRLISAVRSTKEDNFDRAVDKAIAEIEKRIEKLVKKGNPDKNKVESLKDSSLCIRLLSQGCQTFNDYKGKIESLFKDIGNPNDIQLSSVHKSKGLEHRRVDIIIPEKLPHRGFMRPKKNGGVNFQAQQEKNLAYVADTRAMETLAYIQTANDSTNEEELSDYEEVFQEEDTADDISEPSPQPEILEEKIVVPSPEMPIRRRPVRPNYKPVE